MELREMEPEEIMLRSFITCTFHWVLCGW